MLFYQNDNQKYQKYKQKYTILKNQIGGNIEEFKNLVNTKDLTFSSNNSHIQMVSLLVYSNNYSLSIRFDIIKDPKDIHLKNTNLNELIIGMIYYENKKDNSIFNAQWLNTKNYDFSTGIIINNNLTDKDKEIIKLGASRVASNELVNDEIRNIFTNLF